jgi:hypothetical protein
MKSIAIGFALTLALVSRAGADPILGFAPAHTDMVLCSDIATLETALQAERGAAAEGAIARLQQLREQLPIKALRELHVRTVCTFHVRETDHQVAVLELDQPAPAWLAKKVIEKSGRRFFAFSRTAGLGKWEPRSLLGPELAAAAQALIAQRFWAAMDLTDAVRQRLIKNSGTVGARMPEIEQLQQLRFVVTLTGATNDVTLDVSAGYRTTAEAAAHGAKLKPLLAFDHVGDPAFDHERVSYRMPHVSYEQLNVFLSQF